MATTKKPAKLASKNGKPAAEKIVKECKIRQEFGRFYAFDVRTNRKVSEGATEERCRFLAGFRHGYALVVSA